MVEGQPSGQGTGGDGHGVAPIGVGECGGVQSELECLPGLAGLAGLGRGGGSAGASLTFPTPMVNVLVLLEPSELVATAVIEWDEADS